MFRRLALALLLIVLLVGIVSSQTQQPARRKVDPVLAPPDNTRHDRDFVYAATQEMANRIPVGFVGELLKHRREGFETSFGNVLGRPKIQHLGWSFQIQSIVPGKSETTVTVIVTPRIRESGRSATPLGGVEAIYKFNGQRLTLADSKVKGSIDAFLFD